VNIIDEKINTALTRSLALDDVGLTTPEAARAFCDEFARRVASRYLADELSWPDGDQVMNNIFPLMTMECGSVLPEFAWDVYLAFDAGEIAPGGDAVTRPLLVKALADSSTGPR